MQNSSQTTENFAHKTSTPQSKLLVIEREFDVPVRELFQAFETSEAIKAWWWPKDLYADRVDYEFREGGQYFINMKGFDKGGGGMTGEFKEIIEDERIVMTDQFADENGNPITAAEAKMPGEWPELIYITFEFESLGENKSRFILSQEGIPNELQEDCIQGWTQSFDKLENFLARH
jgi:uncharacterized protein YndB with AHSA1/START domain